MSGRYSMVRPSARVAFNTLLTRSPPNEPNLANRQRKLPGFSGKTRQLTLPVCRMHHEQWAHRIETTQPEFGRRTSRAFRSSTSRSEEHTSELQSPDHLVCRLLLEKKHHHSRVIPQRV